VSRDCPRCRRGDGWTCARCLREEDDEAREREERRREEELQRKLSDDASRARGTP
jgi:hypothetical protein